MRISVLTPTFNRANLLPRIYDSLIENLDAELEIEWLIMDDESTDNTKMVIEKFRKEKKVEIKYYWQKNQGKMVAINKLVEEATGELLVDCDSDDYFTKDAFSIIKQGYEEYKEEKDIYALCFLKYNQNGENMGNLFSKKKTTMFDLYFKEGETGEKALVFFTEIRRKYQHELVGKERFITEARMYHKMDKKSKMIGINKPIMVCEYQSDGYSRNIRNEFKENPFGYYEYFKEIFEQDMQKVSLKKRLYVIKHYILFSYLTNQYCLKNVKGFANKIWYLLLWVPGVIKSMLQFK